jgi:rubrerythrin
MNVKALIAALSSLALTTLAQAAQPYADTLKNLQDAYKDEANAHHRYAIYAKKADKEGLPQAAKLFRAASQSEETHSNLHRSAIQQLGGTPEKFSLEKVTPKSTRENLGASIKGESYERDTMYPQFMKKAEAEKATPAVQSFKFAREGEASHAKLFQEVLKDLGKNPPSDYYVCEQCGYTVKSVPGKSCPVCHGQAEKYTNVK